MRNIMCMLKVWLKKISIIAMELAVITGAFWYVAQQKGIRTISQIVPALEQGVKNVQLKPAFPQLSQPAVRTFSWEYKGTKYSLRETLYQSVYAYYQNQPKEFSYLQTLPSDWENQYYAMFLKSDAADQTIPDLASGLQALGKKHKLTDDQIVDLTLAFVQSIPYDDAKAKNILAKTGNETMRFPYEVLWEQTGVCSDKSLLAYALLRQMGYGAALFAFEQDNHMAVAVECPQDHSTYSSGYCYAETTSSGNKIGVIPGFDNQSNKPVEIKQLSSYDAGQIQQLNLQTLGQVTILLPTQGNLYSGIIQTEKIASAIEQLQKDMAVLLPQLQTQKSVVSGEENSLQGIKSDLEKYSAAGNIDKYNAAAEKYNNLLSALKKDLQKYNASVNLYNQDVQKYNALIKQ